MGAFWSLILYDATTFWLVANPINRYEIASHTEGLVYGADGSLTGYGGGLDNKVALLHHEGISAL